MKKIQLNDTVKENLVKFHYTELEFIKDAKAYIEAGEANTFKYEVLYTDSQTGVMEVFISSCEHKETGYCRVYILMTIILGLDVNSLGAIRTKNYKTTHKEIMLKLYKMNFMSTDTYTRLTKGR